MTESVPPDPGAADPAGEAEPPIVSPDTESFDVVSTEPVVPLAEPVSKGRMGRGFAFALGYVASALVGALLLGASLVAFGGLGRAAPTPVPTPTPTATPPPNVVNGPSLGSTAAAVTVEVWADYQCPYCRLEAIVFGGSIERTYVLPGLARIVYRDFAFLGQESVDAAVAARCAGRNDPGAYWRYHDLLFASQQGENQGTFKRANLVTLAGIASVDPKAFTACLDDPKVAQAVTDETLAGRALGIESTPTLRVSGPGGTRTLAGFSDGWSTLRDAMAAVSTATPSGSPAPDGGSSPTASAAPGLSTEPSDSTGPSASTEPSASAVPTTP